ncbi:MAG: Rieske 2Fe-2S domain-containing protein [Pseudoxanthomonas sp.]
MSLISLNALPEQQPVEVEWMRDGDAESFIVIRHGAQVRAWMNVCPHAGRRMDYAPGQFLLTGDQQLVCAVHGATFRLDSGECTGGPCRGQSLLAVPVEIREGEVVLA